MVRWGGQTCWEPDTTFTANCWGMMKCPVCFRYTVCPGQPLFCVAADQSCWTIMVAFAHLFIRGDHLVGLSLLLDISKVVFGLKYGGRFDPPQRMKPRWWQILLMNLLFLNMLILLHSVLSRFPDLSFANSAWRTRRLLCTNNVYINRARPLQVFLASGFTARQILALVFPLLRPTIRAKCFTLPSVKNLLFLRFFFTSPRIRGNSIFHISFWFVDVIASGRRFTCNCPTAAFDQPDHD